MDNEYAVLEPMLASAESVTAPIPAELPGLVDNPLPLYISDMICDVLPEQSPSWETSHRGSSSAHGRRRRYKSRIIDAGMKLLGRGAPCYCPHRKCRSRKHGNWFTPGWTSSCEIIGNGALKSLERLGLNFSNPASFLHILPSFTRYEHGSLHPLSRPILNNNRLLFGITLTPLIVIIQLG